jgi:hypothetical protein
MQQTKQLYYTQKQWISCNGTIKTTNNKTNYRRISKQSTREQLNNKTTEQQNSKTIEQQNNNNATIQPSFTTQNNHNYSIAHK